MKIVFFCEINSNCQKILMEHWPSVPLSKDINAVNPNEIPQAELWTAGFPCQDISMANQGKRAGLNGSRSGLFFKFAELIESRNPRWFLIENVPGILNTAGGKDFRILLETLEKLGYGISWRVLDAKYFGTAQRRKRIYIVGSLGNLYSAKVLFESEGNSVFVKKSFGQGKTSIRGFERSLRETVVYSIQHASIGRIHTAGPQGKGYRNDGETYTLDSRGAADVVCKKTDSFGVRTPTGISPGLDRNRYQLIGNSVAIPVIEWIGKRILDVENEIRSQNK
jgi:DNA (cytosine-5)-methyltransferase 1